MHMISEPGASMEIIPTNQNACLEDCYEISVNDVLGQSSFNVKIILAGSRGVAWGT